MFIALHHNVSTENIGPDVPFRYTYGLKDICVVFFYFLICIVMHAIIQEYILDVSNNLFYFTLFLNILQLFICYKVCVFVTHILLEII